MLVFTILIMWACVCARVFRDRRVQKRAAVPLVLDLEAVVKLYVGAGNQVLWKNYSCFRVTLEALPSPPQVGGTAASVFLLP